MEFTLSQIIGILGIPSLATMIGWIYKIEKKQREENKALKSGVQALLRSQMITDYNHWNEKGFAPIYARENFENCWKQYHDLGANGVMDDIHEKFANLPVKPCK